MIPLFSVESVIDSCINSLYNHFHAPIAQLDRAFDYESKGRRFESCWAHIRLVPYTSQFLWQRLFSFLTLSLWIFTYMKYLRYY